MNYSKPEVKNLGDAKMVIEGVKQTPVTIEPPRNLTLKAAYDLDE